MTILVTGGCGFVGLAVTEALLARGERVTVLDMAPLPSAAQARFAGLPGALRTLHGDVRDERSVAAALAGMERMVVAAAITCGPVRERQGPEQVIGVNVGAVATAVRLAAEAGLRRVVQLSSVAVYGAGPQTPGPLTETAPCCPRALYGITKLAGEAAALRLAGLTGLDLVAARLGACFGPWEHDTGLRDTLSPQYQVLRLVRRGMPVTLDRDAFRDWLYVRDAAASVCALLDAPQLAHRVYNVGSGLGARLSSWSQALGSPCSVQGPGAAVQSWSDRPPASIERLVADTGFRPAFGLAEAAIDWLRFLDAAGDASLDPRPITLDL